MKARDNNHEGVYIDDIIIGFAERGEIVTGTVPNVNFAVNTAQPANEINVGPYQLEIRRAADFGISDPLPIRTEILTNSFDTNDRLEQKFTITAPAGTDIADGQTFTLSDGVDSIVFEFEDLDLPSGSSNVGVTPGRVAVQFRSMDAADRMAERIRDAINSSPVQNLLDITAALSDGVTSGTSSTSNLVNLFGIVADTFSAPFLTVLSTTRDGEALRNSLLGSGFTAVGNATLIGSDVSAGFFTNGFNTIGIESGIILTTGDANFAEGPNTDDFSTGIASGIGDVDLDVEFGLDLLPPSSRTQDTTSLEFTFNMTSDDLLFNFVFASEEYNELVQSGFNDVFAFFVDGVNVALIPGTSTPVSINTVNGGNPFGTNASNPQFFLNNDINDSPQFLQAIG